MTVPPEGVRLVVPRQDWIPELLERVEHARRVFFGYLDPGAALAVGVPSAEAGLMGSGFAATFPDVDPEWFQSAWNQFWFSKGVLIHLLYDPVPWRRVIQELPDHFEIRVWAHAELVRGIETEWSDHEVRA